MPINKFHLCILVGTYKNSSTQKLSNHTLKAWGSVVMRFREY